MLFLGASLANLALISLLFFTGPLLTGLFQFATSVLHTMPKMDVRYVLDVVQEGRGVTFVYLGLILLYALYAARDAHDRACEKRHGKVLPRFVLSMPEATSGSYLLHFSIICSLIAGIVFLSPAPKPRVQVTDIELLQENKPPAPKPEPPKPKQIQKVEKKELKPVKAPDPKPTPVAFAVPTDKPVADPVIQSTEPPGPPPPQPTNETAGQGNSQQEEVGGDGDDVDFGNYLTDIQKRIKKNWFPPRGAESLSLTLKFRILKDGSLGTIKLVKTTGITAADDAGKAAITSSAPFPPLPKDAGDFVDVKFTFDYNVFNGKLPAPQ
jgi:outer membrane biosynthesis protein TonB